MANVTVTWTNGRKTTHVQGRDPRPTFARKGSKNRATTDRPLKSVCVLNEAEAEQLEIYGRTFPCNHATRRHTHYSRAKAEQLVNAGEARWVGNGVNVLTYLQAKTWQPMNSGGMTVMQMVPGGATY